MIIFDEAHNLEKVACDAGEYRVLDYLVYCLLLTVYCYFCYLRISF